MAVFYLDTSAIVKRYRNEEGTGLVDGLLDGAYSKDRFYISLLSVLEVTSAALRLARVGLMTEDAAKQTVAAFRRDVRERFRLWPVDEDILGVAVSVVEGHRLRSGDAIHLATASTIFGASPGSQGTLVSSDHELLGAAVASGIRTLDPQDPEAFGKLNLLRDAV
ncbi:MAG: type II toxin-antitoxin system VapC family toxin [Chloroflexi bacterium]|nr:type II toxin-antitoxin system VapC family toxin [Chloroflexota bacterium]